MALPFALRPRIRMREGHERANTSRVQSLALPVAAYWGIMGLLTYGVGAHWLQPDRWLSELGVAVGSSASLSPRAGCAPRKRIPMPRVESASGRASALASVARAASAGNAPGDEAPLPVAAPDVAPPLQEFAPSLHLARADDVARDARKGPRHFHLDAPYSAAESDDAPLFERPSATEAPLFERPSATDEPESREPSVHQERSESEPPHRRSDVGAGLVQLRSRDRRGARRHRYDLGARRARI